MGFRAAMRSALAWRVCARASIIVCATGELERGGVAIIVSVAPICAGSMATRECFAAECGFRNAAALRADWGSSSCLCCCFLLPREICKLILGAPGVFSGEGKCGVDEAGSGAACAA